MLTASMGAQAWAQGTGGGPPAGSGGLLVSFLPFLLIFIVFYFLLILPQQRKQKKHRAMLEGIKKGDRVLTTGGILGTVAGIQQDVVTLQIADNVRVKFRKEYIAELRADSDEGA